MMRFDVRKAVAVLAAVAMMGVAGPVAVSAANAADAPAASETAAQHVYVSFHYGKGDYGIPNSFNVVNVAVDKGASLKDAAAQAEAQYGQPRNEGNVFAGWSSDGLAALDGSTPIDGNTDLYPVFVKAATVTFNGLDAAAGYKREVTLKSGSTFSQFLDELKKTTSLPAAPEGYELVFSTDQDGKNPVAADKVVTDGLNVFAAFVAKPAEKVEVSFWLNDSDPKAWRTLEAVKGETTFAELARKAGTPTLEGKVFAGWHAVGGDVIDPASTLTFDRATALTASWKDAAPAKVNVAFHQADGNVLANIDGVSGDTFDAFVAKLAAEGLAPDVPEGKVLAGWQLAGGVALPELVTGDLDVFPVFKPVPVSNVTVTFVGQDGATIASVSKPAGSPLSAFSAGVTAPSLEGQEFVGWSWDSFTQTIDPSTPIRSDATVYTVYRDAPQKPVLPWWPGWWGGWQHWFQGWFHGFAGWWR